MRITQVNQNVGNVNNTLAAGRCATCRCLDVEKGGALCGKLSGNAGRELALVTMTYDGGWEDEVAFWINRPAAFGCVLHEEKEKA